MDKIVTIIGRGNSGTRILSHIFEKNGINMGKPVNDSGDYLGRSGRQGPHFANMYKASKFTGKRVPYKGNFCWDFSDLFDCKVPIEFKELIMSYLEPILDAEGIRGWKLPQTLLAFPWITRMFPDIYYIYQVRDPRDCVITPEIRSDDIRKVGTQCTDLDGGDIRQMRAVSWKYQYDIIKDSPKPRNFMMVRFEDLILDTNNALDEISDFLDFKVELKGYEMKKDPVGRWKTDSENHDFDFLSESMKELRYD